MHAWEDVSHILLFKEILKRKNVNILTAKSIKALSFFFYNFIFKWLKYHMGINVMKTFTNKFPQTIVINTLELNKF